MHNQFKHTRTAYVIYSISAKKWYNICVGDGFVHSVWEATRFKRKSDAIMWCSEDEEIFAIEESISGERA